MVTAGHAAPDVEPTRQTSPIYRVERSDKLSSLARLYRTTIASLKNWNRLRTNAIQVGQRLTIFTERTTTATN